jgi:sugar lactone lactonase YvrE
MSLRRAPAASAAALLCCTLVPATALHATTAEQTGWVRSADTPLPLSTVTLYQAGGSKGAGEVVLGAAETDADGFFSITYQPPQQANVVLYLIADGPGKTTRLATVLGTTPPAEVTINERTTVATAYCMAQFIDGTAIGGNTPGVQNSAGTFRNLVDPATGDIAEILGTSPNGMDTSTMRLFNALANMLAGCVGAHVDCDMLFSFATPPGGTPPENTLDAAVNIAHFSWHNPVDLYLISLVFAPYQPALTNPPITWTLALKYVGNGHEFDGPGNVAFDADGNAWINNNYQFKKNHDTPSCGGHALHKLTPTGRDFPGAPYNGKHAGLDGAGFGITLDPYGNVWVGNFGFFGATCPCNRRPLADSVSMLNSAGEPISPSRGFTHGCIGSPQSTVSDPQGNIWIANACNGNVTQYPLGCPEDAWVFDFASGGLVDPDDCPDASGAKPFGLAIDSGGNAWVSDNSGQLAFKIDPAGNLLTTVEGDDTGFNQPMGVAVDSQDNAWVSNSGVIVVPCVVGCPPGNVQDFGDLDPDFDHASVTKLDPVGNVLGVFTGGGVWIPWGNAVDGADSLWVANFGGHRVSAFHESGEPIAPHGFHSDALERNTGVAIDPSGNVWLTNNWLIDAVQTNPGGDGMVVFIGLAAPVQTPLIGPPRRPQ